MASGRAFGSIDPGGSAAGGRRLSSRRHVSLPRRFSAAYESRCVVVSSEQAARALINLGSRLIVVLDASAAPGLAERLVEGGHHVFCAYGPDVDHQVRARSLARPWRYHLELALRAMGLDDARAHAFAARRAAALRCCAGSCRRHSANDRPGPTNPRPRFWRLCSPALGGPTASQTVRYCPSWRRCPTKRSKRRWPRSPRGSIRPSARSATSGG